MMSKAAAAAAAGASSRFWIGRERCDWTRSYVPPTQSTHDPIVQIFPLISQTFNLTPHYPHLRPPKTHQFTPLREHLIHPPHIPGPVTLPTRRSETRQIAEIQRSAGTSEDGHFVRIAEDLRQMS